jgi:hypothetical protein
MPVMLKVRELQQSQLVVEVQVDLAHWKNSEKTEKAQKESSSEES